MTSEAASSSLPPIIQGGMGVAVSGWRLARAVSQVGQLGVVSGTAIEVVHARTLADGDPGGHLRRAYAAFPVAGVAERALDTWYRPGGRAPDEPYPPIPMFGPTPSRRYVELTLLASFAEVWLAKEGHSGPVGVNLLQKIQIPTIYGLAGAMLADVDVVIMGAGIPSAIPGLLDDLAVGGAASHRVDVEGDPGGLDVALDPISLWGAPLPMRSRPLFLAVVSSHTLAAFLAKDPSTEPDGFVIEGPTAGGHNAPPRGRLQLDGSGQPVYGERDVVDLEKVAALGLPFWLAGGHGRPGALAEAVARGAHGIQVGTAFALCEESGLSTDLRQQLIDEAGAGALTVRTDPLASPSGYPFKVAALEGTVAMSDVYQDRTRVCDLGYLRVAYRRPDGTVGLRCAAEPVGTYIRKGGRREDTDQKVCLCNGLTAAVGLGQVRSGGAEAPVVTIGDDVASTVELFGGGGGWTAADVVRRLLDGAAT